MYKNAPTAHGCNAENPNCWAQRLMVSVSDSVRLPAESSECSQDTEPCGQCRTRGPWDLHNFKKASAEGHSRPQVQQNSRLPGWSLGL